MQRRGVQAEFNIGVKGLVAGYDTVGNYPVNENEALALPMLLVMQHYRMTATMMLVSVVAPWRKRAMLVVMVMQVVAP